MNVPNLKFIRFGPIINRIAFNSISMGYMRKNRF